MSSPSSSPSKPIVPSSAPKSLPDIPSPPALPPKPTRRRPDQPIKGILKPPPPPAKPSLGNRLRDMVVNVGGSAKSFFDPLAEDLYGDSSSLRPANGPTPTASSSSQSQLISGTLNALSGKIGLGFSRLVAGTSSPGPSTPGGSPAVRSTSLPDTGQTVPPMSEKSRQKQPLKRATFVLPSLSITYPISSQGEPWSIKVIEDRDRTDGMQIESIHRNLVTSAVGAQYWTSERLVALYESACRGREERPRVGIVRTLEVWRNSTPSPHALDAPLNRHAAEAFADVLAIEWGLVELKLENGVLESEDALKPILHALLVSGNLPFLSLAGNKKIRSGGWRLLGVFLKKARSLQAVNLSDTTWDRKSVEGLLQALHCTSPSTKSEAQVPDPSMPKDLSHTSDPPDKKEGEIPESPDENHYGTFIPPAPLLKDVEETDLPAAVQTLRLDGCGLRGATLEALAQGLRSSDIRNLSLRRNRIGPLGGVSLALMIRDYPDSALSSVSPSNTTVPSNSSSPSVSLNSTLSTPAYAAYVPRSRRPVNHDDNLPPIPLVTSSPAGGITTRTVPEGYKPPPPPKYPLVMPAGGNSTMQDGPHSVLDPTPAEGRLSTSDLGGASVALQRSVRALDGVERIGRLLTLDLKGNDLKTGVNYIAQVLKRNRTLKVLNLSDNKIEPSGLLALAEALKYNSTLETLDLSSNPCCGPALDGVSALRTAFTVNTTLKRLFISDTSLTTEGSIFLAEFLPESKSLLHLDLTSNPSIEPAGILALSVGLKNNHLIRCLDLSIPPNQPDLAELSQGILQSCIRNTESAAGTKESSKEAVWAPIKRSVLVRHVRESEEMRLEKEREQQALSPQGQAREYVYTLQPPRIPIIAQETTKDLEKWYEAGRIAKTRGNFEPWEPGQLPKTDFVILYERAKALKERLIELIQSETGEERLQELLNLHDILGQNIDNGVGFVAPPRLLLPSQIVPTDQTFGRTPSSSTTQGQGMGVREGGQRGKRHTRIPSIEISSPNFSIGDSDGDSDAEELDVSLMSTVESISPRGEKVSFMEEISPSPTPKKDKLDKMLTPPRTSGIRKEILDQNVGETSRKALGKEQYVVMDEKNKLEAHLGIKGGDVRLGRRDEQIQDTLGVMKLDENPSSPVEKVSKQWVEEEGEIFRKGTKLGVIDDDEYEEEMSGEQLKKEILDTAVPRSPTRRVIPGPSEAELAAELRAAMEEEDE
ncbi:hypothetical protein M231_06680 [Tremella mesenterica]|uniref:RNI-like protein n=1 Tax=Tremella mesenterica TaxID=5217 RepID=A0A4Q1BB58_TREME|nr:hypothetical protein M231_06680 [Tremella mesenterica]